MARDTNINIKKPSLFNKINLFLIKRVVAFFVDYILINILSIGFFLSYNNFISQLLTDFPISIKQNVFGEMGLAHKISFPVIFITYFSIALFWSNGQTFGKLLTGLKVMNEGQKDLDLLTSFKRAIVYYFCVSTGFLLMAIPFITKSKKGIPDWISFSYVVDEQIMKQKEVIQENIIISEQLKLFSIPTLNKEYLKKAA